MRLFFGYSMNFVNPQILCETSEDLSFNLSLNKLKRAADLIEAMDSSFLVSIHFFKKDTKLFATGNLTGNFKLKCQRCLDAFNYNLEVELKWNLVNFIEEEQNSYEDFDQIELDGTRLGLVEVLEDEVIMAIPFIPKCKREDCKLDLSASEVLDYDSNSSPNKETSSPFAILRELKFKD